jgi:molybdopterin-containing oxidoreductase family iron-sulfur binding subunit
MTLVAVPHAFLLDGRYANQPWAQEVPDPMSGHVWDTWAVIHPSTAAKLGVSDNDTITINAGGVALTVGVEVQPTVRPDVVAVPMGGGHTAASGRYAESIGQNVATALARTVDPQGTIVWHAKCSVAAGGGQADLISTFGGDHDRDRGFVALCNADTFAHEGDKPVAHPGEFTGIHHLELDKRLRERDIEGFYPIPDHPVYRFGLTVDTNKCTGCGACSVACYAENNLPVVGKEKVKEGREMSWIRINRYFKEGGSQDHGIEGGNSVHFTPLMCQQCNHAPCESVCPVLATYHSIDGLNAMVYNRCAGTRYCSNACPYSARKFNYHTYVWPEPFNLQLNPDVATRTMGVMEKCTFCVQRIRRTKSAYRDQGFRKTVPAEALSQLTACAEACPSQALTFGNIIDEASAPHFTRKSGRNFFPIADIHTYPAVNYLAKASFHFSPGHHGGGEHAEGGDHGEGHGGDAHGADAHGADKHEPAHDAHGAH